MKLKTFTQAYFLIKSNTSYQYSLIKRAKAVTNGVFLFGFVLYAWYPTRFYATESISWLYTSSIHHNNKNIDKSKAIHTIFDIFFLGKKRNQDK